MESFLLFYVHDLVSFQNLTENCLNYLQCSNDNLSTTTMYGVQSTETTTTPMSVNLTFTEMSTVTSGIPYGYHNTQIVSGKNPTTATTTNVYVSKTYGSTTTINTGGKTRPTQTTSPPTTTSQSCESNFSFSFSFLAHITTTCTWLAYVIALRPSSCIDNDFFQQHLL